MKKCSKCKIEKDESEFYKDKHAKSGLRFCCKKCDSERKRIGRWKNKSDLSIMCKYCGENFTIFKGKTSRIYCSKSCQSKAIVKSNSKVKSLCLICEKEFEHYGERKFCSVKCNSKYLSMVRVGENNPAYKENKNIFYICKQCKKESFHTGSGHHKGVERQFCSRKCHYDFQRGKSKDGGEASYLEPYSSNFTKFLKGNILKRDNYSCLLCGVGNEEHKVKIKKALSVHHVDYEKKNSSPDNLVTLCLRCHQLTNFCRDYWKIIFTLLQSNSIVVRKGWGFEVHIVNNPFYCLKFLVFFEGKKFSLHYHKLKRELWLVLMGKFNCLLGEEKKEFIFSKGDKLELLPNQIHQLQAIKNSIIVEVSTRDFDEDSYRIIKGD